MKVIKMVQRQFLKTRFSRCILYRHNAAIGTDWNLFFFKDIHCSRTGQYCKLNLKLKLSTWTYFPEVWVSMEPLRLMGCIRLGGRGGVGVLHYRGEWTKELLCQKRHEKKMDQNMVYVYMFCVLLEDKK